MRYYVKALGIKSKTDAVDAQALAMMICQQRLNAWRPISQAMYELRQLTRQQADLQVFKTKISNHLMSLEKGMYQAKEVKKQMTKLLAEIAKQIDECEKLIAKAIAENAEWKRKMAQICAIKGVGCIAKHKKVRVFHRSGDRPHVSTGGLFLLVCRLSVDKLTAPQVGHG